MADNYYVILGIRSDATQEEIKSAYRREAKRRHPDCSGEGSEAFLLVRDAYEVLSDPQRRRAHDAELARERRREHRGWNPQPGPAWMGRPPVEPVTPARQASRARDPYTQPPISTLFEELFGAPRMRAAEELHTEVTLTRHQARHGGRLHIWLPVQVICPACSGRGGDGFFECHVCRGRGALLDERALDITFPGGVYDGFTGSVTVRLPGMPVVSLVLHFRVDEW